MKEIRDALRILSENAQPAQDTQLDEANTANAAAAEAMVATGQAVTNVLVMIANDNTAKLTQIIEKSDFPIGDNAVVIHSDYVGVHWQSGATATVYFDATVNTDDGEIIGGCVITVNNGKLSFDWGGAGAFYHDDNADDENW